MTLVRFSFPAPIRAEEMDRCGTLSSVLVAGAIVVVVVVMAVDMMMKTLVHGCCGTEKH